MPHPTMKNYGIPAVLLGLLLGLGACQEEQPITTETTESGGTVWANTPTIDSLNGIPNIELGAPRSTFTGLTPSASNQGVLSMYRLPDSANVQSPWFAAHRALVPGQFLGFTRDKLVNIQFIAYSPEGQEALRQQASKLFGISRRVGDRLEWTGSVAGAVLQPQQLNGQAALVLDVVSMDAAQ